MEYGESKMENIILFGDLGNKELSQQIADSLGVDLFYPDVTVFPDGELRVRVLEDVVGREIIVVKSFSDPVNTNLLEFVFLIDAIKRSGATKITALIPYLAYQRADHVFRTGEAVPLQVVISMIEDAGVEEIIILDPHSIKIPEMFAIPVTPVSAVPLFAQTIRNLSLNLDDVSIVSPDMGGKRRIRQMADLLGITSIAAVYKKRDLETGIVIAQKHEGEIKKICIILDDICSTGNTLIQAAQYLRENGAQHLFVMCTHPVLSSHAPELLESGHFEKVYMTNSIHIPTAKQFPHLDILSVSKILTQPLLTRL